VRDIALILLGWLLGLLAPAIVEGIRRKRELSEVLGALRRELAELRYRAGLAAHRIEMDFGKVDHASLEWMRALCDSYTGANATDNIGKHVNDLLKLTEQELSALQAAMKRPKTGLSLKKYAAPLLDMVNEEIDQGRFFYQLTFQQLGAENRGIVEKNLEDSYVNIARQFRRLADSIGRIDLV